MPIIRKPSNSFTDWTEESPSVLDFPGEGMLRSLAKLVMPDETDMTNPIMTGPASPLISIFKNAAARKLATSEFVESARRMMMPNLEIAANTFADKYPRVAAHMRISPEVAPPNRLADVDIPTYGVRRPLPIRFSDRGRELADNSVTEATRTLFHEGNHVGQALGDRRAAPLYTNATKAVGYEPNPYEVNSRYAGDKAVGEAVGKYVPVRRQLSSIAQQPKGIMEHLYGLIGKEHPATRAKSRIQELTTNPFAAPPLSKLWGDPK